MTCLYMLYRVIYTKENIKYNRRLHVHNDKIESQLLKQLLKHCSSHPVFHLGDNKNKNPSDWIISNDIPTGGKIINSFDIPKIIPKLLKGLGKIPKIIHFLWISCDDEFGNIDIPDKNVEKYLKTWETHNPEFEIMRWNGKNILHLIETNFPEYTDFYINLTPTISKCDFARFAVVYVYGGLYTDLDFICRKNISSLIQNDSYFLFEPVEHVYMGDKMYNGFFASVPQHPFILGWLERMSINTSKEVFTRTGPKGLFNYYKTYKGNVFIGNTCDALSILDTNETSLACSGIYGRYTGTLWNDGSGWSKVKSKAIVNIITTINPIDGHEMYWEKSSFITNNYPSIDYEISEKKAIYDMTLSLKRGYGVIDVGAHIGDLAIPLAKALINNNREDVMVYAIDPSVEKCDFIEKMAIINSIRNITVINCGLSKKYGEFSYNKEKQTKNTGATVWNRSDNKTKNTVKFYPLDKLYDEGKIGPIGLYHIDVEGHEVDAIIGSKKVISLFHPIILMEIWIGHGKKCKKSGDCPVITKTMSELTPSYHNSGFLPNGDMIFTPNICDYNNGFML